MVSIQRRGMPELTTIVWSDCTSDSVYRYRKKYRENVLFLYEDTNATTKRVTIRTEYLPIPLTHQTFKNPQGFSPRSTCLCCLASNASKIER